MKSAIPRGATGWRFDGAWQVSLQVFSAHEEGVAERNVYGSAGVS
jgi:hypothetical protein